MASRTHRRTRWAAATYKPRRAWASRARWPRGGRSEARALLAQIRLLIIDDLALQPMDATDTADFCELVVARHHNTSTVLTSKRGPDEWLAMISDALLGPWSTGSPPPPTNWSSNASPTADAKNPQLTPTPTAAITITEPNRWSPGVRQMAHSHTSSG
jgi:hypothetical protein